MIHLFNRTYLSHESSYSTNYECVVLFSKKMPHPITRNYGIESYDMPLFDDLIQQQFENSEDVFWKKYLDQAINKKFIIFADTSLYNKLLIQYWKSIFPHHTIKSLYQLFNFYALDGRLKMFLNHDYQKVSREYHLNEYNYISLEDFSALYEKTQDVPSLKKIHKDSHSFEFLLSTYFYNKQSDFASAFKFKLKELSWYSWVNDLEILKGDILNSIYDLHRVIPDFNIRIEADSAPQNLEKAIRNHPTLKWILDPHFNERNYTYIRQNYSSDIFSDLYRRIYNPLLAQTNPEALSRFVDDQVAQTEFIFNENYDSYLEKNIEKAFGCAFTNDHLRNKSNQLFPCYVFDMVRSNKTELLKPFSLV